MAKKPKLTKKEIEKAAKAAALKAAEEIEFEEEPEEDDEIEEDAFQQPGLGFSLGGEDDYAKDDVFEEGFKKAQSQNTAVRYHIKKDSQFLCVKGYPYSWEKLQKEYGPGYYMVMAKAMNNGHILKKQSEMVGDPTGGMAQDDETDTDTPHSDGNMAYLAMMNQFQERADAKAQAQAKAGETTMATVMQTVMTVQQKSTEMMMTMIQESNKQTQNLIMTMMQQNQNKGTDPMLALVTTLLTKDKPKDGMGFETVLKLLADKERDTRTTIEKQYEMIEKKADSLAEMKVEAMSAGESEEEESGFKGLIKGFAPVLTQILQNHQANQPTPEQAAVLNEQRRLQGGGLDQGFIDDLATRKTVPAARPVQQIPNRPRPTHVVPAPSGRVVSTGGDNSQPLHIDPSKLVVQAETTQEVPVNARRKDDIFNFCAPDIGNALMTGANASKTAIVVLEKLEKEGLSRQTVANTFRLEDFYRYADFYNLPEEAKPWLKEFHNAIQESARPQPVQSTGGNPVVPKDVARAPAYQPSTGTVDGQTPPKLVGTGNGSAKPLATKRSAPAGTAPRTQSRSAPKNI